MVGAAPALERRLGSSLVLNAAISRQADDVVALIDGYRAAGRLPDTVVLQLGNNGPLLSEQMGDLREALRGVDHIFLVNVQAPVSWEDESNGALSDAADSWPNTTLLDCHKDVLATQRCHHEAARWPSTHVGGIERAAGTGHASATQRFPHANRQAPRTSGEREAIISAIDAVARRRNHRVIFNATGLVVEPRASDSHSLGGRLQSKWA
jgi:hypothetical protein